MKTIAFAILGLIVLASIPNPVSKVFGKGGDQAEACERGPIKNALRRNFAKTDC